MEKPNGKGLRLLALTSCICKIFELMLSYRIRWWVETKNLLPLNQTGFRKGFSCADNLTVFKMDIEESFRQNKDVLAVYLDISNAFNDVRCDVLLDQMAKLGCSEKVLRFVRFLIYERLIHTEINLEKPRLCHKGVPQGGVLSPLFYLIYVTCIVTKLFKKERKRRSKCKRGKRKKEKRKGRKKFKKKRKVTRQKIKILQYADDMVVYANSSRVKKCKRELEKAISVITDRFQCIGLEVSAKKTEFIHFKSQGIEPGTFEITVMGQSIPSTTDVKFLGIYFDYQLSFKKHVNQVLIRANKALNIVKFLRGIYWGADPSTLIRFYKSFVRPIIEYGIFVYMPTQKTSILRLERLQYSAVRLAFGLRASTPTNILLAEAGLMTIQLRAKLLCQNFLLKVFSRTRSITCLTINRYIGGFDRRKRSNVMRECIKRVIRLSHLVNKEPYSMAYNYEYDILSTPMHIDMRLANSSEIVNIQGTCSV